MILVGFVSHLKNNPQDAFLLLFFFFTEQKWMEGIDFFFCSVQKLQFSKMALCIKS